ncbi:Hsp20/alpha crystallin family protein [Actinacidiphila bryophytorum]|nr:Hsp20/alpha crystallin family protein [Actinacidiphila bryophytorum]MBM9438414.1 Hsp20/alpha crystallin family protein [Actinacidiphila bryophytorum]MBN6542312.1 Hsp20/alpha crystallin family protein [Actinacidiphila bryophytorum]
MTLPVHHRPGRSPERPFPAAAWSDPLTVEFDELFERMNRLLESTGGLPSPAGTWSPSADVYEKDDAYVVEAELPGITREDINVEFSERELRVIGEYKEREREGVLRRSTRRTGHFEYRAVLPTDVKADGITASLTDGVLTVTAPKAEATKPQHIEITEG